MMACSASKCARWRHHRDRAPGRSADCHSAGQHRSAHWRNGDGARRQQFRAVQDFVCSGPRRLGSLEQRPRSPDPQRQLLAAHQPLLHRDRRIWTPTDVGRTFPTTAMCGFPTSRMAGFPIATATGPIEPYYGWTWVGYEPWGWAPYHYGRWFWYGNSWAWWPGPVYAGYNPVLGAGLRVVLGMGRRLWLRIWLRRLGRLRLASDRTVRLVPSLVGWIPRPLRSGRLPARLE